MAESTGSKKTYYRTAGGLMGLLALTVALSFLPLGELGVVVSLSIAMAKAVLIALFFMHLRTSSRTAMLFAAAGVYWLLILFGLTFGDYLSR